MTTLKLTHHRDQLTLLQDYLNTIDNRPNVKDIPPINEPLLTQTRNGIKHTLNNNDLLEFIGDRVINLAVALIVGQVKFSRGHHIAVTRTICSNDTLGRLAYFLRLDQHADMNLEDRQLIRVWNPYLRLPPPKPLADLFEAYAGAVYLQLGWQKLYRWLNNVFGPFVQVATADFCFSTLPMNPSGRSRFSSPVTATAEESNRQRKLLDFLQFKRDSLVTKAREALDALPPSTHFIFTRSGELEQPDCERVEIAIPLINLWLCKIFITIWPEYQKATAKAPHLVSAITGLIISDVSLGYLGSLLCRSPAFRISCHKGCIDTKQTSEGSEFNYTRAQLALALKATIGWFYHAKPKEADAWGETWFRPLVLSAHDILVQNREYRPIIPHGYKMDMLAVHEAALASTSSRIQKEPNLVAALADEVEALSISHADSRSEHSEPWKADVYSQKITVSAPAVELATYSVPNTTVSKLGSKWRPIGTTVLKHNIGAVPPSNLVTQHGDGDHLLEGLLQQIQNLDIDSESPEANENMVKGTVSPETPEASSDRPTEQNSRTKWRPIGQRDGKENVALLVRPEGPFEDSQRVLQPRSVASSDVLTKSKTKLQHPRYGVLRD